MKKTLAAAIALALLLSSCGGTDGGKDGDASSEASEPEIIITEITSEAGDGDSSSESVSENTSESSAPESSGETSSESGPLPAAQGGSSSGDLLILVGPNNRLPDDFTLELENVQGKYNMNVLAASSAKALIKAAAAAGYDMRICSAYRTVEKSAELYSRKVNEFKNLGYGQEEAEKQAAMWVAPPGTSEHHTGLSMDIVCAEYWNYYSDLEYDYDKFDAFTWMVQNCADYGFILRYPKGKSDITGIVYEPWHYRYVGTEAAKYIMENGLCLEEYLAGR